jgi:glutaconate CoA-transferase subunit A
VSADADSVKRWLDEWVYGVKDRAAYWAKLGEEAQARLAVRPRSSGQVNYGDC